MARCAQGCCTLALLLLLRLDYVILATERKKATKKEEVKNRGTPLKVLILATIFTVKILSTQDTKLKSKPIKKIAIAHNKDNCWPLAACQFTKEKNSHPTAIKMSSFQRLPFFNSLQKAPSLLIKDLVFSCLGNMREGTKKLPELKTR